MAPTERRGTRVCVLKPLNMTNKMRITLDFETYYDQGYSLSNMSMQEYILHPKFEVICVGVALNHNPAVWVHGEQNTRSFLRDIPWEQVTLTCQNTVFDGGILSWHYGVSPAKYEDTMAMVRCTGLDKLCGGASLDKVSEYLTNKGHKVPRKGTAAVTAKGYRYADFDQQKLFAYGEYCMDDVTITRYIADVIRPAIPQSELDWHDLVIRMFTHPQFILDSNVIQEELLRVQQRRGQVQEDIAQMLGINNSNDLLTTIRSNERFASALRSLGVEPETKISKTTGKPTYAFAKTDKAMNDLLEHPTEQVRGLAEARIGLKSSIEQTRCEKFLQLAEHGVLAIPYIVSGAMTHRLSGKDYNLQNLPSGRKEGQSKALRRSITVPHGKMVMVADSSQIEVRILAFLSQQKELMQVFIDGGDPYSEFAAKLYGGNADDIKRLSKDEDNPEHLQRQVGKLGILSLGYGAGWKSTQNIAQVQYGLNLTEDEVRHLVNTYKETNYKVPIVWNVTEDALSRMVAGYSGEMLGHNNNLIHYDGRHKLLGDTIPAIRLPDGVWICLPNLRHEMKIKNNRSMLTIMYDERKGRASVPTSIWGGSVTGLITQGTAFALMKYQGLQLQLAGYRAALNSHDEYALVVDEADVERAEKELKRCMTSFPSWLTDVPIACSLGKAKNYGDAK